MSEWNRSTAPDILPPVRGSMYNVKNKWKPRRTTCKYCELPVKGWRKVDGVLKLFETKEMVHTCPQRDLDVINTANTIRACFNFPNTEELQGLSDRELVDLVLVSTRCWMLDGRGEERMLLEPNYEGTDPLPSYLGASGVVYKEDTVLANSRPKQTIIFKYLLTTFEVNNRVEDFIVPIEIINPQVSHRPRQPFGGAAINEVVNVETQVTGWEIRLRFRMTLGDLARREGRHMEDPNLRRDMDGLMIRAHQDPYVLEHLLRISGYMC